MDICGNDTLWIPEGDCECPEGGGPAIKKVLYSQLVALQNAGQLEPGMQYRIIDYECTTTQAGTDVVQHPFDIVVVADDENTLNENARAMLRDSDVYYASTDIDAWELKYTVDNDQSRFGWADPVNGKGVVYYMKDEFDNVAPYDFKQIVFERYEILDVVSELVNLSSMEHHFISMDAAEGGGEPPEEKSAKAPVKTPAKEPAKAPVLRAAGGQAVGMFVLSHLPVYAFTFSHIADGVITDASVGQYDLCRNNTIGQSIDLQFYPYYILPDNVFINRSDAIGGALYEGNVIGINSKGNTFGSGALSNAIGDGCSFITAANALSNTTIGNSVAEVCLGIVCQGNVIGENSHKVYIDEYSYRNNIGADCLNIIIGRDDYDNHIGNHCLDILLGDASSPNSIGDTCSNITILEGAYNKLEAGCYGIYLDRAENNTFGSLCSNFYLQRGSGHNTFGNSCHDITLGEYVQYSTFEDDVAYISIGNLFSDLTFETGVHHVVLPGINSGVARYYFLTGTEGTAADPITFTPVMAPYTRYVGLNSQGNLEIWNPADGGVPVGAPVIVNSVSAMTDTSKIYLYTGSEAGYTAGDWYYWDGAAWVSGGAYGGSSVVIDPTLTRAGDAADAKATGDAIAEIKNEMIPSAFATDTASGTIAHFEDGADNIPVKDLKISIEPVQSGSGDPSPSNVRPITGWTGATVTRVGKNFLPPWHTNTTNNGITYTVNSDGTFTTSGTATANSQIVSPAFRLPAGSYRISGLPATGSGSTLYLRALLYESNGTTLVGVLGNDYGGGGTFTITPEDFAKGRKVICFTAIQNGQTAPSGVWKPMISTNLSATDTDYVPYSGDTYNVSFGSAGTVYGGTLDATTGVLTVDSGLFTFDGSESGIGKSSGVTALDVFMLNDASKGYSLSDMSIVKINEFNWIASTTTQSIGDAWKGTSDTQLRVGYSSYGETTLAEFKAFLNTNPLQFTAKLATPQTYQLTPTEVRTLLGINNIWADTGDTEVEYRADTTLYIDKKLSATKSIIAGVETEFKASKNYTTGQYLIIGDSLYKVTANIANGGTITVGTNVTATTVAEQLIALANA